jgi:hypothetical protein
VNPPLLVHTKCNRANSLCYSNIGVWYLIVIKCTVRSQGNGMREASNTDIDVMQLHVCVYTHLNVHNIIM